jgi:uncharacterized protein (AIM24 family)
LWATLKYTQHKINSGDVKMEYEIIGDNLQMVVTKISSGEMVYGEAGAMVYMSENVEMNIINGKLQCQVHRGIEV